MGNTMNLACMNDADGVVDADTCTTTSPQFVGATLTTGGQQAPHHQKTLTGMMDFTGI
jgi:hypothetical protein